MAYTTPEALIAGALNGHLTALTLSPALMIAWPNVPFTPPSGPYLSVADMRNTTDRPTLANDGPGQFQGIYQVTVMGKIGAGDVSIIETAGLIADHFSPSAEIRADGHRVRIQRRPSITSLRDADGSRWMAPVSINWWAFI